MTAKWLVRGDVDGFFGLALDNLIQLLLISSLCKGLLGFDDALLFGRVLPGAAVSLLVGNLFYSWQAMQLARQSGRADVCALPYGINTPSVFAYVFLVMLPVKLSTGSAEAAWQAGLVACLGSALIELFGSFLAEWMRRAVPRAALLSTLAGIALTFIALDFLFRTYSKPITGLATFAVVCLVYFGGLRFRGGVPGGLVAVGLGTALAWATDPALGSQPPPLEPRLSLPVPVIGDLIEGLRGTAWKDYLSIIVPMGLFNVIGSLQNLESAEAAGDRYPTVPSLAANGLGSLCAALFGSCFPTTIYIGHPGWKGLGARVGYSWMNGLFISVACFTGTLSLISWAVPIEAGMAIVLWIGIVIAAQAFTAVPARHAPAVVMGLLPGIAGWGAVMLKNGLRAGGATFGPELLGPLAMSGVPAADGLFALEQGFILTAMLVSAAGVAIIEGQLRRAAGWMALGGLLSMTGIMHGWAWGVGDTVLRVGLPGLNPPALGYFTAALVLALAPLLGRTEGGAHH